MANQAKRILKNIDVQFLSLVNKGANGKSIIYKSANQAAPNFTKEFKIIKTDEEKHLVYATVYEPDEVDSQGDTANAAEIEKACHKFSESLRLLKVDTQHNFEPNQSVVVENFILRSADPMFPETKIGSWVTVIKVVAEEIWAQIKSGEISGLSLAGLSGVEEVEKNAGLIDVLVKTFQKLLPVKKDYNEEVAAAEIRTKTWVLMDAIQGIFSDESVTDKKAAVLASIDQFKMDIGNDIVTKSGKKISQSNLDKIKTAQQQLTDLIATATADTNTNDGEDDMKAEEVAKVVAAEIAKAMKPVTDSVQKVADDVKAVSDRVETVAKAAKGSAQILDDPKPVKKSAGFWLA
jgi:hypothetical protein